MKIELQAAKDLALRAGAILLKHYADGFSVEWKGKNDPVTDADRASSRVLVAELHKRFPNDAILSEEEKDDSMRLSSRRVWIIDPMDGTKEFVARRGEFAVMIGLAVKGEPRLGVVYQPTQDKLYYAAAGDGAYLTFSGVTLQLQVSSEHDPSHATMALSRSHLSATTEAIRQELGIEKTTQTGSLGVKVGLICEAQADVYVQGRGTSVWDTCGPEAILREAGGTMTDWLGNPLRYDVAEVRNLNGVIATNGLLHDSVLKTVREVTRRTSKE
jgi:3'(2'), 5'-bisphosphate nucleotidase